MAKNIKKSTAGITRENVVRYVRETYHVEQEFPWAEYPDAAVLRHADNRKWFGVIIQAPLESLGLIGDGSVEVLDIKCDTSMVGSLRMIRGFYPGYHMNKENWISVALDGSVPAEQVFPLLDISYNITSSGKKLKKEKARITEWLVPSNPKFFDIVGAFEKDDTIHWKQSSAVHVGDTVYMYVAQPYSAILYKCEAVEVNIPYNKANPYIRIDHVMRIHLLEKYDPHLADRALLEKFGVVTVRGPRSMPPKLIREIERLTRMQAKTEN